MVADVRRMRVAAERVLEALGLAGYAYTVEHKPDGWTLTIECGADEAWQVATLPVHADELSASVDDASLREKLRREWAPHVQACVKRGHPPPAR